MYICTFIGVHLYFYWCIIVLLLLYIYIFIGVYLYFYYCIFVFSLVLSVHPDVFPSRCLLLFVVCLSVCLSICTSDWSLIYLFDLVCSIRFGCHSSICPSCIFNFLVCSRTLFTHLTHSIFLAGANPFNPPGPSYFLVLPVVKSFNPSMSANLLSPPNLANSFNLPNPASTLR